MILLYTKIYFILAGLGIGYSLYLTSFACNRLGLSIALAPIIGSSIAAILCVYFLTLNYSIVTFKLCMELFTILSIALVGRCFYTQRDLTISKNSLAFAMIFIGLVLIIASTWNNYKHGHFYHRLGPDEAAYAMTAAWFKNGMGLPSHAPHPYIASIITLTMRWGFPYLTAYVLSLLNSTTINAYTVMQPIAFILFASGAWGIAQLFCERVISEKSYRLNKLNLCFIASCIVTNASLIYFMSEGFYPQILATTYLNIIIGLAFFAADKFPRLSILTITILLSAALICVYSECYAFVLLIFFAFLGMNIIRRDSQSLKIDCAFILAMLFAIIIIFPLGFEIITFTIKNTHNLGNIGYPQPTWMLPSDITGLSNIFSNSDAYLDDTVSVHLAPRSLLVLLFYLSLSAWVVFEIFKLIRNKFAATKILTLLCIASALFICNIYLLHFKSYQIINYLYDKLVTCLAPTFTALLLVSILFFKNRNQLFTLAKILIVMVFTFSSIYFLAHDKQYNDYVDIPSIQQIAKAPGLAKYELIANQRGYRNGAIQGKSRYIDETGEYIMVSILDRFLLDQRMVGYWELQKRNPKHYVAIIVRKKDLSNLQATMNQRKADILLNTNSYLVLNTRKKLSELMSGDRINNLKQIYVVER